MAAVGRCTNLLSGVFRWNLECNAIKAKSVLQCANCNKQWSNPRFTLRKYHKTSLLLAQPKVKKEKKIKLLKLPALDDVYREDLYEPQTYDLTGAIATMKRYMELDFAPPESLVWITLGLHPAPVKKGLQVIYALLDLPHEFNHTNRVCVLTEDVELIKMALNNGALLAGGDDVIQRLTLTKIECDGYVCSPAHFKTKIVGNKELMNVMKKAKPRGKFGLSEDIIYELTRFRDETIITNFRDQAVSEVIVGQIHQSAQELEENILAVIEAVRTFQNPKHPPIVENASISCCEENIPFTIVNDD